MFLTCAVHRDYPFHVRPGNVFWCQDVLKFLRQIKLRRDAQQKNEIKLNFHLETPVMHLGSINRFRRAAGIKPKMHSFLPLFQIVRRKAKHSQSIYWFVVRWCFLTTKSLTYSYLGSKRKAVSNKTLDKLNSFSSELAESLEHHRLRSAIQKISIFGVRDKDSSKTSHAFCSHLQLFTRFLFFFPFLFLRVSFAS